MGARIDRKWADRVARDVDAGIFVKAIVSHNINSKWLIGLLGRRDYAVKVINLGAGVKKIIAAEHVCPNCGGKGFVNGNHENTNNRGS